MDVHDVIPIGTCTFGPVVLSQSTTEENKHSLAIIKYEKTSHANLVSCKTTSKGHEKLWPGEFLLTDLFGRGPTKVQPYNVVRIRAPRLSAHQHVGLLSSAQLPQFQFGLRVAVKKGLFDAKETLDLASSWQHLFPVTSD